MLLDNALFTFCWLTSCSVFDGFADGVVDSYTVSTKRVCDQTTLTDDVWEVKLFKGQPDVRAPSGDSLHRGLQPQKGTLLNRGGDFGAYPRVNHALMHDYCFSRLLHAAQNGSSVPGIDGAQVNQLNAHAQVLFGGGNGVHAMVEGRSVGDNGYIRALFDNLSFGERQGVGLGGNLLNGSTIQDLGFHKDDGIRASNGGEEQTLGLAGGSRHDDAQARDVGEERLGRLGVVPASHVSLRASIEGKQQLSRAANGGETIIYSLTAHRVRRLR